MDTPEIAWFCKRCWRRGSLLISHDWMVKAEREQFARGEINPLWIDGLPAPFDCPGEIVRVDEHVKRRRRSRFLGDAPLPFPDDVVRDDDQLPF